MPKHTRLKRITNRIIKRPKNTGRITRAKARSIVRTARRGKKK